MQAQRFPFEFGDVPEDNPFASESIIAQSAGGISSIFVNDLIFAASSVGNTIKWYKDDIYEDNQWIPVAIDNSAQGVASIFAADLDDDFDVDLVSASPGDNTIAWYENTDGEGNFSSANILPSDATGANAVFVADLNNDGQSDILAASENQIFWFENTDGQGNFSTSKTVAENVDTVQAIFFEDLDTDNDNDILAAYGNGSTSQIVWYENVNGDGSDWLVRPIDSRSEVVSSISAAQVDDGGLDVIVGISEPSGKVILYENLEGQGTFSEAGLVADNLSSVDAISTSDINFDLNVDIVAASTSENTIVWYSFSSQADADPRDSSDWATNTITTNANNVNALFATDFDGDADGDVFWGGDNIIAWYENRYLIRPSSPLSSADLFLSFDRYVQAVDGFFGETLQPEPTVISDLALTDLFDETFYLSKYEDVATAVASGAFETGYDHFTQFGLTEGREPSSLFDTGFYLDNNPDVAEAVDRGDIRNGLLHFLRVGHLEGRDPSALFDQSEYINTHSDLPAALDVGAFSSGFEHYIEFGIREGRAPNGFLLFDESFYLRRNPDVGDAVANDVFASGFEHFVSYGSREGRRPSNSFEESFYLNEHPDVANAIAVGALPSGFAHYIQFGRVEDRTALT